MGTGRLMPPPDLDLSRAFADVARELVAYEDLDGVLGAVCRLAVSLVDGAEEAGVSVLQKRQITTHGATGELPELVDRLQYESGEGPCVEAIREEDPVVVGDLAAETRWPSFREAASGTGVRSMLAFRLWADNRLLGALNLYARQPGALAEGTGAVEVGAVFAGHAAAAILAAERSANLGEALANRSTISMAVGLLMGRQNVSEQEAFDMLKRASQRTNVKLRHLARQLTERAGGGPGDGRDLTSGGDEGNPVGAEGNRR